MTQRTPEMDERAVAVDNRAGNIAFQVLGWMLIADMGLRSLRPEWTMMNGFPVDVFAMLFVGGAVHTTYIIRARTVGSRRARNMVLSALTAAAIAAAVMSIIKAIF